MDDRLVTLEIFERSSEANVLASKLRAYGIFTHVDGPIAGLPQVRPIQLGGIPVKVRARDYETAKNLMEDVLPSVRKPMGPFARNVPTITVISCTAIMMAAIVWTRMGTGNEDLRVVFFALLGAYLVTMGEAIRTQGLWWLLLTLPVAVRFAADLLPF